LIKKLTVFEINRRVLLLGEFRNLVVDYFNSLHHDSYGFSRSPSETQSSQDIRGKINHLTGKSRKYLREAGSLHVMDVCPPPAVGGYRKKIDLLQNLFLLHTYRIEPQNVTDMIEQAIGVYEAERDDARIRTFNPVFWLGVILSKVSSAPFKILEHAGLHGKKFEDSIVGRILKLISEVIVVLAALYGLLHTIGREDLFHQFLPKEKDANKAVERNFE
jgi:hypothetical protein